MIPYKKTLTDRYLEDPRIIPGSNILEEEFEAFHYAMEKAVVIRVMDGEETYQLALKQDHYPAVRPPFSWVVVEGNYFATLAYNDQDHNALILITFGVTGDQKIAPLMSEIVPLTPSGDVTSRKFGEPVASHALAPASLLTMKNREGTLGALCLARHRITMFVLSLMNCRNTERIEHRPPEALSRKHSKKHGRPLASYYTLDIRLTTKLLRDHGMSESGEGLTQALHLCRGHFKDYRNSEKGLFGKLKGIYWWEPSVRGDVEEGVLVKDYRIKL